MGIFKKNNNSKIIITVIVLAILGAAGYFVWHNQDQIKKVAAKEKTEHSPVGIVDYEKLLREHPDFHKLEKLDQEIYMIAPPTVDPARIKKIHSGLSVKLQEYKKQVEKMLVAERNRIHADSNAKMKKLHTQMGGEFRKKQLAFAKYKAELEKQYLAKNNDPNRPLTPYEKEFKKRLRKYSGDLIALKDRQVVAKDLELRKKSQAKLMAEETRLTKKLSEYEDQLRKEHQNEKLNLQLKMQVAKDEQERETLQKKLTVLYNDEKDRMAARRKELSKEFSKLEKDEGAKNKKIINAYRKKLEKDVNGQLSGVHQKIARELQKEGIAQGNSSPHIPKELKDKLEARRKELMKEMNLLEEKLKPRIKEIEKEAETRFNKHKNELIKKLQAYQKSLDTEFKQKSNVIIGELETAGKEAKKTRDKLLEQRKNLFQRISGQINEEVAKVAKEEKVDLVLGEYMVNLKARDLNSKAQAAVRNISRESK